MDYISPSEVAGSFVANGAVKSKLPVRQLLLRGALSGALLGFATTVAFTANAQGLPPIVGAVLFPVGFAMIVILGLELVTGSFAMLPAAWLAGETSLLRVLGNLVWVFAGNLAGGCLYAWMYAAVQTQFHHVPGDRRSRFDRRRSPGQNARLREAWDQWPLACHGESGALQLDGLHGRGYGPHVPLHAGQDRRMLAAHLHLLCAGIRALSRQHVHHPGRHVDGCASFAARLVAVESASRHSWQPRWRISICGPADALASRRHAYKDRVATPRNGRGTASGGSTRRS